MNFSTLHRRLLASAVVPGAGIFACGLLMLVSASKRLLLACTICPRAATSAFILCFLFSALHCCLLARACVCIPRTATCAVLLCLSLSAICSCLLACGGLGVPRAAVHASLFCLLFGALDCRLRTSF